ncbi:hypothetical protein MG293_013099 [Ovis ammon polii]|uniref:Uncharacterized protein n=1 Tax=Ovis ammon polii TaxID=230172 RepID=A0AAD4U1R9_OVIAM|nr:hypothetical protein MG293_013099 [Ovis ammon polii]KAI4563127.1 hypothetical protein MJT46_010736 [Ovis ammon polii x Ovis aries]
MAASSPPEAGTRRASLKRHRLASWPPWRRWTLRRAPQLRQLRILPSLKASRVCKEGARNRAQDNIDAFWYDYAKAPTFNFFWMFPGDSDESTVETLPALGGSSLGSSGKKKKKASPNKDYMFDTLNQLETDLVKFVSRARNLKLAMATGSKLSLPSFEVPADKHNNITLYELWGDEDFDEDSE